MGESKHDMRQDMAPRTTGGRCKGAMLALLVGGATACLGLLVSFSSITTVRTTAKQAIDQEVRDNLSRLASMIASTIDADAHRTLTHAQQEGGEVYNTLNAPLTNAIARTEGVRFVYTLRAVDNQMRFVLDGTPWGDSDGDGVEDHSRLMEVYKDPDPAAWDAINNNYATVTPEPFTDAWGTYLSAFAPVRDAQGVPDGVVGVDVSAREYQSRLARVDRATAWAFLPGGLMSLAAGMIAWWGTGRFARYAREIMDHREQAVRANNAKSVLLANISHELRTPLNAIIGFVNIAGDHHNSCMERTDAVATVRHNAEHLLTLINDLLDISKAEAGVISIDPTEIDLPELIERAVAPLRMRAMEKRIRFHVEGVEELPARAMLDRTRVRQILLNLLSNAVKFTDTGAVHLLVSAEGAVLRMRVADTGPGMNPDEIGRLFTPFTQVGSHEKRVQGTGLGLAISHHLTGLMGGKILVESTPGIGSVFTVEIPFVAVEHEGPDPDSYAPSVDWERLGGVSIAVAEDGEDNRRLLRLILKRAGALVTEFGDGEGARRALMAEPDRYDLLITDWDMPVLTGAGLVRKLRDAGWSRPVISLTAHAMPEQESECLSVGCDAHLTKPLSAERLVETCAALLAQHGRGRAA